MGGIGGADQECAVHISPLGDVEETVTKMDSNSNGYDVASNPGAPVEEGVFSDSIPDGQEHVRRQEEPSATPAAVFPAGTLSGFLREGFHTVTIKPQLPSTSSAAHDLAASELRTIHLVGTTQGPKPHDQRAGGGSEVSSGTKVTIGVSVMVGVLAIVALIAWHMRVRMRFCNKKRISRPIKPSSLPATPLISPSSSYAGPPSGLLTPPPRLQERRFLLPRALSLRRNNHHGGRSGEHSQQWAGVPLSPLSIPRARGCAEDGERLGITATTTISQTTSPTRPPRDDAPPGTSVSSIFSSASTLRATSNASTDSAQNRYSGATAIELPRPPPRVYEAPPVVGGLASPGPPPNRALPSLPLDGRTSPLKSPLSSPTRTSRGGSPSVASRSGSPAGATGATGATGGNGDSQRPWEDSSRAGTRRSAETALQSPRRVRHVRSPLLNEISLDKGMKK
ncbi:hypothetical protein Trco_004379 [Trichoderma cornu-damae]|uniref:Uncharacterized protein n=1 Tax=Trichoderma cornu-damae TaxID=654480 RepID=A0A9P8QKL9_9HYPO|nr:hypothetical protein Trco_004379 [Trichoderma cornu-damae]